MIVRLPKLKTIPIYFGKQVDKFWYIHIIKTKQNNLKRINYPYMLQPKWPSKNSKKQKLS